MKNNTLDIDIISDVVCPWCAIGYGRLRKALDKFAGQIDVNLRWHPFELNPGMAKEGENLRSHLAAKYGTTLEGSIKARAMLTDLGKKVDFTFNYFDEMKMLNTHDCHQLLLWASNTGLQTALALALFEEFFTHQGDFAHERLLAIVEKVGLDVKEAQQILENQTLSENVKAIENQWAQRGLRGVPAFIFNGEQMISGAQEAEAFEEVIETLIK